MKTIKQFAAQSNIPATLIRAVVRQMGGWEEFKSHAEDVSNHGANGGFSGFIYYSDTAPFCKRNKTDIIAYAKEQAKEFDTTLSSMIANFNCINLDAEEVAEALYHHLSENLQEVYNALAWYALEEVARAYCDINEQEGN